MVKDRFLMPEDEPLLEISLADSKYHKDTTVAFFKQPGTFTRTYEDEQGAIIHVRQALSLRIDIHFMNDNDIQRNKEALLYGFQALADQAKKSGFTELYFTTSNPALARFCNREFGFEIAPDKFLLRKYL